MGFGYTYALDKAGDTVFNEETQSLDLVEGVDCLTQALTVRLKTVEGGDTIHPSVGLPILQLLENGFSSNGLRTAIEDEILDDPRIRSVNNVIVETDLNTRTVVATANVTAVDGTTFDVSLLSTGTG